MDGHFVPNISIGVPVVESLRKVTDLPIEAHLMVESPNHLIPAFAKAGSDIITVHVEACKHLHRTLQSIRALGKSAGVALNPSTLPSSVEYVLHMVDLVLVMTVNPGFSGQEFLPEMLPKIERVRQMVDEAGLEADVAVDGGVSPKTAEQVVRAGANFLVAGTSVFRAKDISEAVRELRRVAEEALKKG